MPNLVIFHADCTDGFGAAYAAWLALGDSVEFVPGVYGEAPPDVDGKDVFLLDFSYKKDQMAKIIALANSVTILDHHESAAALLRDLMASGVVRGAYDDQKSGAVLAWEHFHPGQDVPTLLQYVQDHDLWRHEMDDSRAVHAFLVSWPMDFAVWHELVLAAEDFGGLLTMRQQGAAIDRRLKMDTAMAVRQSARTMVIGGHSVSVANLPKAMASDGAGALAEGQPFGACYYDGPAGRVFSLRSRGEDGIDVSKVAVAYGGGGHVHAAGFTAAHGWEGDQA
jgi:oligoribonuclease NrnB/cAMP/cGMP phosphodiesterase (DHH superfamily)